jgi:hypothetical protein
METLRNRATTQALHKLDRYRLLVLSCSQRKLDAPGEIPALQRYDGPAFRVVRRYCREVSDPLLDIRILSAQYGIIGAKDALGQYDRKMDRARAVELRESCISALRSLLRERPYGEVFLCMSRVYLNALEGIDCLFDPVQYASPGQGKKLASLRRWLRGETKGVAALCRRDKSWRQ